MHLGYYAEAHIEVSMVVPDDRYAVIPVGKVFHRHHLPPAMCASCGRACACSCTNASSSAVPDVAVKAANSVSEHQSNATLLALVRRRVYACWALQVAAGSAHFAVMPSEGLIAQAAYPSAEGKSKLKVRGSELIVCRALVLSSVIASHLVPRLHCCGIGHQAMQIMLTCSKAPGMFLKVR